MAVGLVKGGLRLEGRGLKRGAVDLRGLAGRLQSPGFGLGPWEEPGKLQGGVRGGMAGGGRGREATWSPFLDFLGPRPPK